MCPRSRRLLDWSFSALGVLSIVLMGAALLVLLVPIFFRGTGAFVFRGTVEYRRMNLGEFNRGDRNALAEELKETENARRPVYAALALFEQQLKESDRKTRRAYGSKLKRLKKDIRVLLGPLPGDEPEVLPHRRYGQVRWDRALVKRDKVLYSEKYDYSDPTRMGTKILVPRIEEFRGGPADLSPLFAHVEDDLEDMLRPRWTFYWRFLFDKSVDAHFFGGIWPELLGTFYLTVGAVLFGVPMGVIAAVYLVEYAREGKLVRMIRTCISTLAGVPSIVFGLFGLALFINTLRVSESKSVLAGSLTLAVLILPTIIRASEEAIKAVPRTYKEAALSLGATRWRTVMTVILPAALPGILTGIVISMGRAAGETAPIIFTAAWSVGAPLKLWETLSEGTPALPWNIYNLCTEHKAVDEIRHVQYGMVLVLVLLVLLLNVAAIVLRARISKKLRG
jgi:phosphate transport system permease protein